jgi:hypothetical protein
MYNLTAEQHLPLGRGVVTDIVAIPTCYRPELLALCLTSLSEDPLCPDVHIYADTPANIDEIEYVRDHYFPTATIFHAKPHIQAPSGCWNILNAIKNAAMWSESVYLVEEDIRIYPGTFFKWHQAQTAVVSVGRKDKHFYSRWPGAYTNPGAYLRRPALDLLIPHINDDFFARLRDYMDEHFEKNDAWSNLDDGLIRRVVSKNFGDCAFPERNVCAHQGFYHYGKLDIFMNYGADIEERIGRFLELEHFIQTSPDPRYKRYGADFEPYDPLPPQ